jgi:hypothetical protein
MATKAELARVRRELRINVGDRSKPRGARYTILGRGWDAQRIHLLLNHEDEADAKARELAAMPGQSPVAVIDTGGDRLVTFYFADGRVCSVLRNPALMAGSSRARGRIRSIAAAMFGLGVWRRTLGSVENRLG